MFVAARSAGTAGLLVLSFLLLGGGSPATTTAAFAPSAVGAGLVVVAPSFLERGGGRRTAVLLRQRPSGHRRPLQVSRISQSSSPHPSSHGSGLLLYGTANPDENTSSSSSSSSSSSVNHDNERLDQLLAPVASLDLGSSGTEQQPQQQPAWSLRPAIEYLRQHPDLSLTRSNWDALFLGIEKVTSQADDETAATTTTTTAAANNSSNNPNNNNQNQFPIFSPARQEMTDVYDLLRQRGDLRLYGAVTTQEPPATGLTEISPPLLQEILNLPMSALTPAPTNTVLWLGAAVALLEIAASLATGVGLNVCVVWTLVALACDRLVLNGAVLETALKWASPGVQAKILRHEAGHFLVAYLLGCPVEGIVLSAWAALKDRRFGSRQVSAGTSFFDPILSQQINQQQQVTRSSMDRYAIIVMAGIAAEADHFGRADGGAGDELALIAFLSRIWNGDKIRNQARWGALQAVLMLRQYKPAYEALVEALESGGATLGDAIWAVERAARQHNLPGRETRQPIGSIVNEQGVAVWKVNPDQATAAATTSTNDSKEVNATARTEAKETNNKDASLEALKQYRTQMEQKLRDVDEKLKELS